MKNFVLLISSFFFMLTASSADFGFDTKHAVRYPVKFKIEQVKDNCPKISGQEFCQSIGSVITIKAKLNTCVDKIVEFNTYSVVVGQNSVELHVLAMAEYNPLSPSMECIVEKTIRKNIRKSKCGISSWLPD